MLKKTNILNKGYSAGGARATINGFAFEQKTSIENKLFEQKFNKIIINKKNKFGYYFENNISNMKIIYLTQTGFKLYFKQEFDINVYKYPDEAFLIFSNNKYYVKILEKKIKM